MVSLGSPPALACGLLVAARDSDRDSDAIEAARCSFEGSSWARTSSSIEPSWERLRSRSPGFVAQPLRELAQLLGRGACAGRSRRCPWSARSFATSSMRCGLPVGLVADLAVRGDDGVLRVREEDRRHEQRGGDKRDQRGPPREARPEQPGLDVREASDGVAALAPDEARLGVAELEALADGDRLVVGLGRRARGRRASPGRTRAPTRARRPTRLRRPPPGPSRRSTAGRGRRARAARACRRSGPRAASCGRPLERARSASRSRRRAPRRRTAASTYHARRTDAPQPQPPPMADERRPAA